MEERQAVPPLEATIRGFNVPPDKYPVVRKRFHFDRRMRMPLLTLDEPEQRIVSAPFTQTEMKSTTAHGATILVVDDEAFIRNVLRMLLETNGYRVLEASGGKKAVELYETHPEDIAMVMLDVRMPDLNGPETLEELQKLDPSVRCCFMSGDLGGYTADELIARGAVQVFLKPFFLNEFIRKLKTLL